MIVRFRLFEAIRDFPWALHVAFSEMGKRSDL
jgi:hypothetical protein